MVDIARLGVLFSNLYLPAVSDSLLMWRPDFCFRAELALAHPEKMTCSRIQHRPYITVSSSTMHRLDRPRRILQGDLAAGEFEKLTAALVSDLTGVGIAVAASGFQHGGDAGPAGREGRRFRVEMKRYSDTTSLSNRELLGEVDHAITRDKALEGWFLVATREVTEQLELELQDKSEKEGIP
ncbi:MAG TPA: hypothetical protein DHV59_10680 [Oxalobacteraceae bacterium]|nr:hypothetical protein [Oxalobacteraceae bacterium]